MPESFRFSPRPNQAHKIEWRPWGAAAFDEAEGADKPMLLNLTTFWCQSCHSMDETTYSDPAIMRRINDELIPLRVDADRYPHVHDRYIAGGWPTNAFLTPTGEVLWAGTYVEPEEFVKVAGWVLDAWRNRRSELSAEIVRRRRALDAARSGRTRVGLVRWEAADDVLSSLVQSFDARNGGFGEAPKFPHPEAIELAFSQEARTGDAEWGMRADRTLDGMLAGEVWDRTDGGFFRYALEEDWTAPRYEKKLEINAALLRVYAKGARLRGRDDWRETAERTVAWVESTLRQPDGLWSGSQDTDEEYFQLHDEARRDQARPAVDTVVYTSSAAEWIRALADAGVALDRKDWIERAAGALRQLLGDMGATDGLLYHCRANGGEPELTGLLTDAVASARAAAALEIATGESEFLDHCRGLADAIQRTHWADEGGFRDYAHSRSDPPPLRYTSTPFDVNAGGVRLFLYLARTTGERSYRATAERTLAVLSPMAGRYGVGGAEFALAVEEFFDGPAAIRR